MVGPKLEACPRCGRSKHLLEEREKYSKEELDEVGRPRFAGRFLSCPCGALTLGQNGLSLLNAVAEEYGIKRLKDFKAVAVPPVVRKRG